jgi:hypothetical protein
MLQDQAEDIEQHDDVRPSGHGERGDVEARDGGTSRSVFVVELANRPGDDPGMTVGHPEAVHFKGNSVGVFFTFQACPTSRSAFQSPFWIRKFHTGTSSSLS